MKIIKRIFYTIFGILLICTISLIGVMLYAEYTGKRFHPDTINEIVEGTADESRLAYDDSGNIIELPGNSRKADSETEPIPADHTETGSSDAFGTDVSNIGESVETPSSGDESSGEDGVSESVATPVADASTDTASEPVSEPVSAPAGTDSDTEQLYIMDLSSNLFHTANCSDAAEIPVDQRSERSTVRNKILDAGYEPCPHCNP